MAPKTIAVDLDDTLNDFTAVLSDGEFPFDPAYALAEETFRRYLESVRRNAPEASDLQSTSYTYFRRRIHQQCYGRARPRADAVEFMQWLRQEGWRIVICTHRDLRQAHDGTRQWLEKHGIPFDYLFMAMNKIVFCRAWDIGHLIDDDPFYIDQGPRHGVNVYYPILERHRSLPPHLAQGFQNFAEVRPWITR